MGSNAYFIVNICWWNVGTLDEVFRTVPGGTPHGKTLPCNANLLASEVNALDHGMAWRVGSFACWVVEMTPIILLKKRVASL